MTPQEWGIMGTFIVAVFGVSFLDPRAALLLAGIVAGFAFYQAIPKLRTLIGGS